MQAITMVTLGVADVAAATGFYLRWGWEQSSDSVPGEVSFLHSGTATLGLFGRDALAEDAGVDPAGSGFRGVSCGQNLATPADVDARFAAGIAAGATVIKEPEEMVWGGYSGYLADPDGHLWELAHNPEWPLREDGGVDLPGAGS